MKILLAILITLSILSSASADDLDILSLLKRDLGDSIEVHSAQEIWYCPDNTCDMYKIEKSHPDFTAYIYLHLFYESDYVYLLKSNGVISSFREIAVEEPKIRAKMAKYCPKDPNNPICILKNLKESLNISLCWGRYDEGGFCYGCKPNENICKKH